MDLVAVLHGLCALVWIWEPNQVCGLDSQMGISQHLEDGFNHPLHKETQKVGENLKNWLV